ncbi:hypothetical protein [Fuscibacter oryzae]|uniref:Uncharacterized protein n=1 Tax=Fuscibacter oryzae TaxID=2803939 RepID=A0A8J7MNJ9_9RHOB|nr:hypothetical protein [Fuscibacter oryzae]MBL4927522.1 hypothetical protein [Fuscibacter oryzae]
MCFVGLYLKEVSMFDFNVTTRTFQTIAAVLPLTVIFAAPVAASPLGGGLGIGAEIGGISAGASIGGGGGSVASADVSVGDSVGASATVGSSGGTIADVSVGVGGSTAASACVGNCSTTTPPGTTPGVLPGAVAVSTTSATPPVVPKRLPCASKAGNTTALNGYPLVDRDGNQVGVVHSATLGNGMAITQVSIQSQDKSCVALKGGGFTVQGYVVRGKFDADRYGLVTR